MAVVLIEGTPFELGLKFCNFLVSLLNCLLKFNLCAIVNGDGGLSQDTPETIYVPLETRKANSVFPAIVLEYLELLESIIMCSA